MNEPRVHAQPLWQHIDRQPGLYLSRAAAAALAALIAYQCATLYGVIVSDLDGRQGHAARPSQLQAAMRLSGFDPFFTSGAGRAAPIEATGLTLHGLRQDRGTGGGSAIIGQSDGTQRGFATGDEIAPGIVLKQVAFDHVVIERSGLDARLDFKAFATAAAAPPERPARSPYRPAQPASSAVEARPARPAPRAPALPARSIDFADPSTLPASLTSGPALPARP